MLPDFSTWLRNQEPLVLEESVRVSLNAPLWPGCFGRVRKIDGSMIGVYLAGLTNPGEVTWYHRSLLEKNQW